MLSLPPSVRLFVATEAADMRKSFDGLSGLVRDALLEDPLSGHLFVFFNRRRDRVKVLWWDRSGYVLLSKRLEKGRFALSDVTSERTGRSLSITAPELALIFEGIDLRGAKRRVRYERKIA